MSLGAAPGPARAGLVLAWVLAVAGLAPERAPAPCDAPRETERAAGWTIEVACGVGGARLRGPARLLFGQGIDPNRADAGTLESLPGIGAARAAALVEARGRSPFCTASDLEPVKGIGPRTRQKLEPWLIFAETQGCGDPP